MGGRLTFGGYEHETPESQGQGYIVVRIDHRCVPAIVEYATDDNRRWSSFRDSAEQFNKRDGIAEAKRLRQTWPGQYRVVGTLTSVCIYDSAIV